VKIFKAIFICQEIRLKIKKFEISGFQMQFRYRVALHEVKCLNGLKERI
jgi:hypothetical protein